MLEFVSQRTFKCIVQNTRKLYKLVQLLRIFPDIFQTLSKIIHGSIKTHEINNLLELSISVRILWCTLYMYTHESCNISRYILSYVARFTWFYSRFIRSLALDRRRNTGKIQRRRRRRRRRRDEWGWKKYGKSNDERQKAREREGERDVEQSREGIFCFVGPGKLRTGSSVSAVAMPFTRGGRTALTVFPLRELLGGPTRWLWCARLCASACSLSPRMEGCRNTNGKSMAADHSRGFKDSRGIKWHRALCSRDTRSFHELPLRSLLSGHLIR